MHAHTHARTHAHMRTYIPYGVLARVVHTSVSEALVVSDDATKTASGAASAADTATPAHCFTSVATATAPA